MTEIVGVVADVRYGVAGSAMEPDFYTSYQQYVLPADVDPAEFTHAYVWCRAFSVGFTRARLA